MSSVLGTLVVRIAAEMARYKGDLNEAIKVTEEAAGKIDQSTQKVSASSRKGFGEAGAAAQESAQKQVDASRKIVDASARQVSAMDQLKSAAKSLSLAYVAYKVVDQIRDMTMLNARYQELGVVMGVVGKNAGYSAQEMAHYAGETQKMGISMVESRNTVIQLAQAEVDLANASKLARVAQDAAVIGNTNSSNALATMIHGIKSAQTDVLRTIGINVNFEKSYKDLAGTLGVTTEALSEKQKMQARENAVMDEGAKLVGAYEASMNTAGKQIRSMTRYVEDLKVIGGEVFNEVLTVAVMGLTSQLKDANEGMAEMAANGDLKAWGVQLASTFVTLANSIDNTMTIIKMAGTWAAHQSAGPAIEERYNNKWAQTAMSGDYSRATKAKIMAEKEAALKAEQELFEQSQTDLAGAVDRFERSWDKRQAAHAEALANIASTEKQYLSAQLVVQKAYAGQSLKVQQDAQIALRDGYFGADPKATRARTTSPDNAAAKAYKQSTKSARDFIEALKEETQQTGLNADQVKMLGAARAAAKAPTAALREEIMAQALALSQATTASDAATAAQKEAVKADIDAFKSMNDLRIASEKQVESAKGMLFQLEFETRLIGMNADARALATMERELETQGIVKGTAAYDGYIARLREAMALKNATQTVEDTAKKAADEWNKFYDSLYNGLTDSLYRAFEQGGSFFKNFWNGIKNLFKTTVLKLGIQGVVGGVTGMMGMNAANASTGAMGGGGNMLGTASNLSTMYSGISSMVTLGGQVVAGTMSVANALGTVAANATGSGISGLLATNGAFGTATGAAGAAGGVMAGVMTAVPYVAAALAVAAAVGLFRKTKTVGQGISGTFGEDTELQNYTEKRKSGYLFGGPKYWKEFSDMDAAMSKQLTSTFGSVKTAAVDSAKALGLSADGITSYRKAFTLALSGDQSKDQAAISALFVGMADDMARAAAPSIAEFAKDGETASVTLQRLSTSITSANAWLSMLRNRLFDVSMAGADAASKLADAFGSLDNLAASSAAYYELFYSEAERTARSTEDLAKAMALVNVAMPATKAAFRDVVTGLDLNTEAGRNAYAVMLALAPEFAATGEAVARLAAEAAQSLISTFTGGGRLIPALNVAQLKVGDFTGSTTAMSGELSFINSIMGDSTSRVIAFRNGAYVLGTEMSASQRSAQMLHEQIADLGDGADSARIDFAGLAAALASVDTETFVATVALMFESLAERIGGVIDDIGSERIAVREAALQIINPTVMGKDAIQRAIGDISVNAPGNAALIAAQQALGRFDANVAANKSAVDYAKSLAPSRAALDAAGGSLGAAQSTTSAAQAGVDDFMALDGGRFAWWVQQGLAGNNPIFKGGIPSGEKNAVDTAHRLLAAQAAQQQAQALYNAQLSAYGNAVAGNALQIASAQAQLTAATAAQSAAVTAARDAQLAYVSSIQDFAIDASKAVTKLSRLREETVKYYEQQKQLADLMGKSAAGLRTTVADYRYKQLSDAQQLAKLQEQFSGAYAQARATSGDVMAGYGDKLNALLPALIDKLGETGNTGLIASYLAQAESVAGLIEAAVPVNYQQDSLSMLGAIDATLAALDASSQSAEKIISAAVNAGSDRTAAGLHAVVAALTGQSIQAFAAGGYHAGGARLVGEYGPEIEVTGPSRIFSASQTRSLMGGGGDAEMLQEMRALRQELTQQRYELRAIATSNAQMARLAKIQDDNGMLVRTDSDTPLNVEVAP